MLWLLFVLSAASFLVFVPPELSLVLAWVGRLGMAALLAMVAWWAYTGFSGYEHFIGWRIVMRTAPPPNRSLKIVLVVLAVLVAATQAPAAVFDLEKAPLVVAIAAAALVAIVLLMLRVSGMATRAQRISSVRCAGVCPHAYSICA